MKNKFISILIIVFLFSCSTKEDNKNITLKIGNLKVTKYEYERNRRRELMANINDSSILNNAKRNAQWKKDFVDRCFIINDAYEKHFDTIISLMDQVKAMGDYMMCSRNGYLWKATISPIADQAKKITPDKIEKRKKLYHFDCILCKDIQKLIEITQGDTVINSKEEFLKLKSDVSKNSSFTCNYISDQWPFLRFWNYKDYLYNLNIGETSKLLHQDGQLFYFYLDHIEDVAVSQQDLENMSDGIQFRTEDELIGEMDSIINATCEPKLNQDNISMIVEFLESGNNISDFREDLELVNYKIDGDLRNLTFKQFLKYCSLQPLSVKISTEETLLSYIESCYKDDYLINEANKLDLYHSDEFVLDQRNYRNNLFYNKYIFDEITSKVEIDSFAIVDYYNANHNLFKQPKSVRGKLYVFDSMQYALSGLNKIRQFIGTKELEKTKDKTIIEGLINFSQTNLDMESEMLPFQAKSILLSTSNGSLTTAPFLYNDTYVLFYKENQEGESYLKLSEVYSSIERIIKNQRIEEGKGKLITELKGKYKLEIDNTGI